MVYDRIKFSSTSAIDDSTMMLGGYTDAISGCQKLACEGLPAFQTIYILQGSFYTSRPPTLPVKGALSRSAFHEQVTKYEIAGGTQLSVLSRGFKMGLN